jgi:hypothetical protein
MMSTGRCASALPQHRFLSGRASPITLMCAVFATVQLSLSHNTMERLLSALMSLTYNKGGAYARDHSHRSSGCSARTNFHFHDCRYCHVARRRVWRTAAMAALDEAAQRSRGERIASGGARRPLDLAPRSSDCAASSGRRTTDDRQRTADWRCGTSNNRQRKAMSFENCDPDDACRVGLEHRSPEIRRARSLMTSVLPPPQSVL